MDNTSIDGRRPRFEPGKQHGEFPRDVVSRVEEFDKSTQHQAGDYFQIAPA
jgi:hypothetical protein